VWKIRPFFLLPLTLMFPSLGFFPSDRHFSIDFDLDLLDFALTTPFFPLSPPLFSDFAAVRPPRAAVFTAGGTLVVALDWPPLFSCPVFPVFHRSEFASARF